VDCSREAHRRRALICVSGLGGGVEEWTGVANRLARRGELITLQLPAGVVHWTDGRSDPLAAGRQLVECELRRSECDSVVLIGHSMGALAALLAVTTEPHRVAGLVLTAPFLPVARDGRSTLATAADYLRHRVLFVADTARRQRTPARRMTPSQRAVSLRALAHYGLRPAAFHADADAVSCPVLLVHGDSDHYVPPAFALGAAHRHPGWQLALIPGAGHFSHHDDPRAWLRAVEPWLDELQHRSATRREHQ
jgi:pimeloyl-ACP methyl ester carboxylesterase